MISEIQVKSVLNKHKKRDAWFLDDYSINPYMGCSVNCLYCYIRGSKYGINMAERLTAKINAPEILEKQLRLRTKKNEYGFIVLASATDPYMPIEEKYRLTEKLGINCLPLLPFISDSEEKIEEMISTCKSYGADYILTGGLTLFGNQPADSKTLYYKFLERKDPHLIVEYKKLYRIFPFPPKEYIQNLERIVKNICEKYNIKNSII